MKVAFYALSDEDLFLNRLPIARHLSEAGYSVVFAAPPNGFADRIRSEGFEFSGVIDAGRTVIGDAAATLSLLRSLGKIRPDIVHTFGLRAALRGGLAARMRRIAWVVHSVSSPRSDRSRRPPPALKAALGNSEVTFRRQEDRDAFIARRYVRPEQTHVLRSSGIDLREYPVTDEPDRTPVAALVSPGPDDIRTFAEAASLLSSEGIPARFAVIGRSHSAEMRTELQRGQELGIVEWWGQREDMAHALSTTHVICVPTHATTRELTVAAAAGRPVISMAGHTGERVLRPGENALLADPRSASDLAESLRDLLTDPDKRRRMGRRAREIVESEYSAECVAREIMGVYERLFEKGRAV